MMPTGSKRNILRAVLGPSGALVAMLCAPSFAAGPSEHPPAASSGDKVPLEVFQGPQLEMRTFHVYASDFRQGVREGWVILSMMVDPSGKPFEVAVTDSSGDKELNDAAVRAMQRASFVPGSLNGKRIESSYEFRYRSVITDGSHGATFAFKRTFKSLTAAIQAKDRPAADAALKEMKVENASEDAFLGLATYDYAQVWGDDAQQLKGLRRALAWQYDNILPKDLVAFALRACLQIELRTHEFAEALATWSQLRKQGIDPDTVAKITPIMQELDKLRLDDRQVEVSGEIRDGSWFLQLFKRQFRIDVREGLISDVKLRCQKHFLSFTFDPKLQYQVDGSYGDCWVQLEGTEGTRFELIEF